MKNEIRAFVPEEYWTVDAKFTNPPERKNFSATLVQDPQGNKLGTEKNKIPVKEECDKILSDLEGAKFVVQNVK